MHIGHAFGDGFLHPFVHLVCILIEAMTAKDIAAGKGRWRDGADVCSRIGIIWSQHIPPGNCQDVAGIMHPLGAGQIKEVTQILNRSRAKRSPLTGLLGFLLRLGQRIFDQVRSNILGIAIPGVGKIP